MQQTLPPAAADAERHRQERRAFLYLPLLALAVTVVVELFNHKSFTDGPASFWRFMTEEPLAFLVNFLIVLLTLCPAFFLRRRAFWCALVSFLWLICGGVTLGLLVIKFRMAIMETISRITGREMFPNQLYFFDELPAQVVPSDLMWIIIISVVLCTLGGLLPAWRAAKLDPAKAFRYE